MIRFMDGPAVTEPTRDALHDRTLRWLRSFANSTAADDAAYAAECVKEVAASAAIVEAMREQNRKQANTLRDIAGSDAAYLGGWGTLIHRVADNLDAAYAKATATEGTDAKPVSLAEQQVAFFRAMTTPPHPED